MFVLSIINHAIISILAVQMQQIQPELVNLIGQGFISAIVLIIWFYTFKQSTRQMEDANARFEQLATQNNDTLERLFEYMKNDNEYKGLLTGILSRLEVKLDLAIKREERERNG